MEKRIFRAACAPLVLLALSASAPEPLVLSVEPLEGAVGERVTVPVRVEDAQRLGPLQLVLRYDPEVLRLEAVGPGALAGGVMLHHETPQPGTVRLALITDAPIEGSGSLVELDFEVLAPSPGAPFELVEARAWEFGSLAELLVDARAGAFRAEGAIGSAPVVLVGLGAVLLLLVSWLATRHRKRAAVAHAGA